MNLNQGVKLDPQNVQIMFNLAVCYQLKNDFLTSKQWFVKVLARDSSFKECYLGLAICLLKLKCYAKALEYVDMAEKAENDLNGGANVE